MAIGSLDAHCSLSLCLCLYALIRANPAIMASDAPVMGLDVGNSTCSIAICRGSEVDIVTNAQGNRSTPTCVGFTEEPLFGDAAREQQGRNAQNTIVDLLLLLGRDYDDPAVQDALARWRFRVSKGKDGAAQVDATLKGAEKTYSPQRLLSLLLAHMRAEAEALCGSSVKEVVIATPPYFNESQRGALKEAAQMGGMRVRQMLSQPLAAALLHTHGGGGAAAPSLVSPQQLLVVDVGGSSSTVSLVEAAGCGGGGGGGEGPGALHVRATATELGLGGRDVDTKLRVHVVKEVKRRQRYDLSDNARAMGRLLGACETAKHSLTASAQATVTVEADATDYFSNISRAVVDDIAAALSARLAALVDGVLADAGLPRSAVTAVLLSGGAARMPRLQADLTALLPGVPLQFAALAQEVNARGAALCAGKLRGAVGDSTVEVARRPLLPRALGIALAQGVHVVAHRHSVRPLAAPLALTRRLPVRSPSITGGHAWSRTRLCTLVLGPFRLAAQSARARPETLLGAL